MNKSIFLCKCTVIAYCITGCLQIVITFFKNGVVIDPLHQTQLKNKNGDNAPLINHYDKINPDIFTRSNKFYKFLNFTGRMDKNGKPIKDDDPKINANPDQMHGNSSTIDENTVGFY